MLAMCLQAEAYGAQSQHSIEACCEQVQASACTQPAHVSCFVIFFRSSSSHTPLKQLVHVLSSCVCACRPLWGALHEPAGFARAYL